MKIEVGKFYNLNNGLTVRINDLNAIKDNYPIDATVFVNGKVPEKGDKHPPVLWFNQLGESFSPRDIMYNIAQEENILKLEVGKTYLTETGEKIEITSEDSDPNYPFNGKKIVNGFRVSYTPSGTVWGDRQPDKNDLVSEYDPLDGLFDEPAKEESQTMQEQQKPLFEVGKTYKNGKGSNHRILFRDELAPDGFVIIARDESCNTLRSFREDGKHQGGFAGPSFNLVPPEPPLPIVIGGFYLDNHDDVRILAKDPSPLYFKTVSVCGEDKGEAISVRHFPKHVEGNFTLVKLLTYEEAQKLINEKI